MMKSNYLVRSILAVCFVTIAIMFPGCAPSDSNKEERSITVVGVADLEIPPDEVILRFRIVSLEKELANSKKSNDTNVHTLTAALREQGIEAKDIQTGYIRVHQRYDDTMHRRVFEGYEVTRNVVVTLDDVEKYEDVLSAALDSGATHIDYADFRTTELRKHRDAARAEAATAAREKAIALANQLDASVGQVISIEETSGSWNFRYGGSLDSNVALQSGSPSVSGDATVAGLITITSGVRVTFGLE